MSREEQEKHERTGRAGRPSARKCQSGRKSGSGLPEAGAKTSRAALPQAVVVRAIVQLMRRSATYMTL